jgi:AraC-like DNA-binding protein
MKATALQQLFPFDNLLEYESFIAILKYYVDLNCFVVPLDTEKPWLPLNYHHRTSSVFDFEKKFGFVRKWKQVHPPGFPFAAGEDGPYFLENYGFYDMCVPVKRKGKWQGTLLSGAFSEKEPTYSGLQKSWNQLSGQTASAENPDFHEFVRVALETPVLEGPVLAAFGESLVLAGRILTRENKGKRAYRRLRELINRVFSKRFPHSYWMNWALGKPVQQTTPIWSLKLQEFDWVRDEIGIRRIPTTVITAVPVKFYGKKIDPIEEMLRVYRFQRRSFLFARTLPQTVGGKLEDYGAVFVTSADPKLGRLAQRQQIKRLALKIRNYTAGEFGGPVLVGVGETVAPGEPLNHSYRQAVMAPHLGKEPEKEIVFFEEKGKERMPGGFIQLRLILDELNQAFSNASFSGLEIIKENFLKEALDLSFLNPHEIRWHFRYALDRLAETVAKRMDWEKKETGLLRENLGRSLDAAANIPEMVTAFKNDLTRLEQLMEKPSGLQRNFSMEKARDYLDEHFHEPLPIARLAKMAGVSISTFSRGFKRLTGLGLEAYLQNRRLEEAKRLLKATHLPVSKIARDCGFHSDSYFSRLIRKKMKLSPSDFRQKSRGAT